ncbi:hypothetical protein V8E52_001935 [Russula decolorans]
MFGRWCCIADAYALVCLRVLDSTTGARHCGVMILNKFDRQAWPGPAFASTDQWRTYTACAHTITSKTLQAHWIYSSALTSCHLVVWAWCSTSG